VAALQSRPHYVHIADALEGVIHFAISHVDDDLLDRIRMLRRIDDIRTLPLLAELRRSGCRSTPMIRAAFAILSPSTTANQTVPNPKTAAVEPLSI